MAYTKFIDAWNDWSPTLTQCGHLYDNYVVHNNAAWAAGTFAAFKPQVLYALADIAGMVFSHLFGSVLTYDPMESMHYAATYFAWKEGGDMDGLIATMMTAEFSQIHQFVGISDAYRTALWDQPFDSQFYAELAASFRS